MKVYFKADILKTMNSMKKYLDSYQPNTEDENLVDSITMETQSEMICAGMSEWPCAPNICQIMTTIPLMIRTVSVASLPRNITKNPWLIEITSLPSVIKHVNSRDFFRLRNKVLSNEIFNSGFLVNGNMRNCVIAQGVGKHISSFLLSNNQEYFHPDTDLAMWAAVIVLVLRNNTISSWMERELGQIDKLNAAVYLNSKCSWSKYVKQVGGNDFRLALVSESPHLPSFLKCPHINKFILACYFQRYVLTTEQLHQRRNALISEFYGRFVKPDMLSFFYAGNFHDSIKVILDSIEVEICSTLRETIAMFSKKVARFNFKNIKIDFKNPQFEFNHNHLSFFGCKSLCQIFQNMDPSIPPLQNDEWRSFFLHGVSHTDSYLRNTTSVTNIDESRVHHELRCEIIDQLCHALPRYCLKQYFEHKHAELSSLFHLFENLSSMEVFDKIWIPYCRKQIMEEIVSYTEPSLS